MELEEFGPDDVTAVDAYLGVRRACVALDSPWEVPPTRERLDREMRFGWDGELSRYFLVREAGDVVGTVCFFAPEHDNRDLAWVELKIDPEVRRRGYGRAALDAVFRLALAEGRPWSPSSRAGTPTPSGDSPLRSVCPCATSPYAGSRT